MSLLPANNTNIKVAAALLQLGYPLVIHTDTVYGIAVDATNPKAVSQIYKIKGRSNSKPLACYFYDAKHVAMYLKVSRLSEKIMNKFLPGPLTIILNKKPQAPYLSPNINNINNNIAIRLPALAEHKLLIKMLGRPIALTSANYSNQQDFYCATSAYYNFAIHNNISVLDSGESRFRTPSTIIKIHNNQSMELIREGPVNFNSIKGLN